MSVTVIIPTYNEEIHLARCLDSVCGWADRVYVVDSFSTDGTVEIAERYRDRGVQLVQHAYEGPADQKNWALDELEIESPWILFLDTDEVVTERLKAAMSEVARDGLEHPVAGYFVNRRIIWYGHWIRYGGWYPNWNLRFFQRGKARYEQRRVHEHMIVDGPTDRLDGDLIHEDLRDLDFSIAKHNRYSSSEAAEFLSARDNSSPDEYARLFTRDRLARKRWIKMRLWAPMPGKGLLYFLWAYVFRLGFLDGLHGLRFHAMHAMYKQFDEFKTWELANYKQGAPAGAVRLTPSYCERHLSDMSAS